VGLKDQEPIEQGLSEFLAKVLQGGDTETHILTILAQETHDGGLDGVAVGEVALAEDGQTAAVELVLLVPEATGVVTKHLGLL
jgi:hypothetical protein